jgi:uncharacterized protein YdiU (UPF0061 family)
MSVDTALFGFDNTFVRELAGLYEPWRAEQAPDPQLLVLNAGLAAELGVEADALRDPDGIAMLVGNSVPRGAEPVAQAYAGHQFGGFSPRLGDGRALLLGEVVDVHGRRRDLHLKGSGRTPFARGGDGRATIGPMLREYVIGEAMHALGIPTTRALAVVATGTPVAREDVLPGAVLVRVAASHLRVGTFEYASTHHGPPMVQRLGDYAIARHYPDAAAAPNPYLALLDSVVSAQASLIARWMLVGFVHGVMNTDNTTISGETIDYGPCAFMESYDPAAVFSSIDHGGRYAYGNQPAIARWNLTRLAEALLPLVATDTQEAVDMATGVLATFPERYARAWCVGMRAKLGLGAGVDDSEVHALGDELLALLRAHRVDLTSCFRALSATALGDPAPARILFDDPERFDTWTIRWSAALAADGREPVERAAAMDRANPAYVPRNHLVEEALQAAVGGDLRPFSRLVEVTSRPFDARPGLERYASPAPADFGRYVTFCGT